MRRRLISPQYRAQLAELRARCEQLAQLRSLGAQLRRWLLESDCPVWQPEQDHLWRSWIETHGDERAKELLLIFEQAVWDEAKERGLAIADELPRPGRHEVGD